MFFDKIMAGPPTEYVFPSDCTPDGSTDKT